MGIGLKKAVKKLNDAIDDLTSLHVQTYSGTVNFNNTSAGAFDNLRESLNPSAGTAAATTSLDVNLKLETLVKFDGDSYNFVATENVSDELFKLHKDALDSGLKTRLGLLEMVKNTFS